MIASGYILLKDTWNTSRQSTDAHRHGSQLQQLLAEAPSGSQGGSWAGHSMFGIQLPPHRLIWLAKKAECCFSSLPFFAKAKVFFRFLAVQSKNRSFVNWIRILASHYCVGFCRVTTWISHKYVYIHMCMCIYISPPSWASHPLCHHRAPSWAPCVTEQLPTSYLFHTWYFCLENSKDRGAWRATERGVAKNQTQVSMLCTHCVYFNATLPTGPALSFSFCVQKSSLYMFLSIPALKIG